MTKAAFERYCARMQRVLDHIDRHQDDDLGLDALSGVAAFSKHHFHRQFKAIFGLPVHRYVQLVRMKRASYRLAFRQSDTVTDIAMDAGYQAPEAFARAFKQQFGQAPTAFRKAPEWQAWLTELGSLTEARINQMKINPEEIRIVDVPATPVAVMEHRGDPEKLGDTIRNFITWRRASGLAPKTSATFTVFHQPEPALPADYHIDLCAGTDRPAAFEGPGVQAGLIPGGRCAILRIVGSSEDLSAPATYLYRDWLPASGEETRDFPLYCQRISLFPDVPEHEAITDLFLPLR